MKGNNKMKGFTLIEIVIAVAILVIVSVLSFSSFSSLNKTKTLDKNVKLVTAVIEQAQSQTLSYLNSSVYGVHFEANRVVLFAGISYSAGGSQNKIYDLDSTVTISEFNLNGGGNDVVFERLTGVTNQNGTVVFLLASDASVSKTITISGTGIVN